THVFSFTDSTYAVTLIVTDNYGCKDTVIDSVYVKPGFSFTFTHDTVCDGFPMHFHAVDLASGDSLYSPYWNFGDPNSGPNNQSFLYNPTHVFTQPGLYAVMLRVTDSDNCTDSTYLTVLVNALPQPDFTALSTPCDSVIRFHDLSLAGSGTIASWQWTFGDGSAPITINAPGPGDTSHIYSALGYYNVILQTTNTNGCTDTMMQTVQLFPCIMARFNPDTAICERYPVAFADSSVPVNRITEWHWLFGDGKDTLYGTPVPVVHHTYDTAGTFTVDLAIRAVVNGVSFTDTARQQVIVHPTPVTAFSNLGVCMHQLTLFTDTSSTGGEPVNNWTWTFGEPSSGSKDSAFVRNPNHQYDTAGYYSVKLVTMNRFGCKDSLTKLTRVYGLPIAMFDHNIPCSDNPTYFTDQSITADTTLSAWMWNFGDLTTNQDTSLYQDPNYIYMNPGDYTVRMIVQDHYGCRDTIDSTVTVHVSPVSSFTMKENIDGMTGKIQLDNLSIGADTYFWDFGNGQNSTEQNPIVTYSEDGTYLIMLISSNTYQCSDTTYFKYEVLFKGLYIPNAFAPTSTNLAVRYFKPIGVNLKSFHIEVYDVWGHLVWESSDLDSQGRPLGQWNGDLNNNGEVCPMGTYMWKATATFIDDTIWEGSDIGKGSTATSGTVTLIR
ncbi:MAG TPA: PKD domain-containing protein, partial [Bacteroidales bacterium]|nr:PKD domain-containing protein [Bacteroidales bacterium]